LKDRRSFSERPALGDGAGLSENDRRSFNSEIVHLLDVAHTAAGQAARESTAAASDSNSAP